MQKLSLSVIAASISLMTGCAGLPQQIDASAKQLEASTDRLQRDVGKVNAVAPAAQPVVFKDTVYVGGSSIRVEKTDKLPAIFDEATWFNNSVSDLREFAERVTLRAKIPVSITPEAFNAARALANAAVAGQPIAGSVGLPPVPAAPGVQTPAIDPITGAPLQNANQVRFNYSGGPLRGLLDMAAARYGVYWRFRNGEIQFYLTDTKTFQIQAVPGTSKVDASVASNSGTSSQSSGTSGSTVQSQQNANTISTSVASDLSVWDGLEKSLTAMLSPVGKLAVSIGTGTVTVTDTPTTLKAVEEFVRGQNDSLGKQVLITVQVLGVTKKDADNYSLSWDLVYQNLYQKYGLANTIAAQPGATSLTLGIIKPNAKWSGSQAIINALSEQGTVHLETTASVVALNNQPAPIQTAKQVTYLAELTTTNTPDVGSSTAIRPGTVSSGFNMQVLPTIMGDGSMLLQLRADVSELREIRSVSSGDVTIEAPEVDSKNFLQRVRMRSGETLVLSGFEQTNGNLRYTGVGSARMPLLGGGINATKQKDSVVVLVTPVIMN